MRDLERVKYVAGSYDRVQGLKTIPFGVLFLVGATLELLFSPELGDSGTCFVLGTLVASALSWIIRRYYYERRFGRVRRRPRLLEGMVVLGIMLLAFVVSLPLVWLEDK